jgi:hypothetical protein
MNKWEKGPVKLANGYDAFIDAINDKQENYRYTGRVRNHAKEWIAAGWHADGRYMFAGQDNECNLAAPPKKTVRVKEMWLMIFPRGHAYGFHDEQSAKNEARAKRAFAVKKIESFEVTEGDGL